MKTFFCILLFIFFGHLFGQEWGEISDKELRMTTLPEDPEASAVILFDIGEMQISRDFSFEFYRHTRIKILTEEGKKQADVVFSYYQNYELYDLDAVSYSPDGTEYELDDDQVFEQLEDDWKVCRFSIPGVQVGSVIEYRYQLIKEKGYLGYFRPWYFQNEVYTRLSQLTVTLRPGFTYNAFTENLDLYDYDELKEEFLDIDEHGRKNSRFIWRVRSIPPLKQEPFMYNRDDYLAKIFFQMVSYDTPYDHFMFIKSWDDLAKSAYEGLQPAIEKNGDLADFSAFKTAGTNVPAEKAQLLYTFVNDSIETIDGHGIWDFKPPDVVLEERRGTPSAKNLLLINLLRHAGIKADPVFISSRTNGKFHPNIFYMGQFDHLLVYVDIPSDERFVDTSEEFCPFGMLDVGYCVGSGFLVGPDGGQVINIRHERIKNKREIRSTITLEEPGMLTGTSAITLEGYPAFSFSRKAQKEELKDIARTYLEDTFDTYTIDTVWTEYSAENALSLTLHISYHVAEPLEKTGSMAYFQLPFLSRLTRSPFISEKRSFPVDYPYPEAQSEFIKLTLPQGIQISDIPTKVSERSKYVNFTSICFKGENKIDLNRSFHLQKTSFSPYEYKDLKRIYDSIVNADQGQIVFTMQE